MNAASWEEAVPAQGCICQFSIIKELEDDLRTWYIFFNTYQQHGTPCSQMLDGIGIYQQWEWVLLQDQPKNAAEESWAVSFQHHHAGECSLQTRQAGCHQ